MTSANKPSNKKPSNKKSSNRSPNKNLIQSMASLNMSNRRSLNNLVGTNVFHYIINELTARENQVYPITNQSAYYIGGTEGSIQFPNLKHWSYKKEKSWWNKILVKNKRDKKDNKTLINQIDHFADVILKKVKPKVSGEDGLNLLKILKAIEKSSKNGKKVKV